MKSSHAGSFSTDYDFVGSVAARLQAFLEQDCLAEDKSCVAEKVQVITLVSVLFLTIVFVLIIFRNLREEKEERITPLCPQLIVKSVDITLGMQLDEDSFDVTEPSGDKFCKVILDWPTTAVGIVGTVRLQSVHGVPLVTVVVRSGYAGQNMAICRGSGREMFGFIEATRDKFFVQHRTNTELLTLSEDPETNEMSVYNPVGGRVCTANMKNGEMLVNIIQHVDAGLALASIIATRVQRRMTHVASGGPVINVA